MSSAYTSTQSIKVVFLTGKKEQRFRESEYVCNVRQRRATSVWFLRKASITASYSRASGAFSKAFSRSSGTVDVGERLLFTFWSFCQELLSRVLIILLVIVSVRVLIEAARYQLSLVTRKVLLQFFSLLQSTKL